MEIVPSHKRLAEWIPNIAPSLQTSFLDSNGLVCYVLRTSNLKKYYQPTLLNGRENTPQEKPASEIQYTESQHQLISRAENSEQGHAKYRFDEINLFPPHIFIIQRACTPLPTSSGIKAITAQSRVLGARIEWL